MIDRYVSPKELKQLLSALLVVVLFIGLLGVLAFLVLPSLRNANQPSTGSAFYPVGRESGWLDPTDYPPEKAHTLPPIDPATVMKPNPDLLAKGMAVFAQTCAPCHGAAGEGDGPAGKLLHPAPRNFTQNAGWQNGYRINDIYKTLADGIKGTNMVSFAYLSTRDRMALVHYVQSLGHFDHGPEDPKALAALAAQFASSGGFVPGRIPVSLAVRKLEQEFTAPASLAVGSEPILRSAVADPVRAALTLSEIPGWSGSDQALARGILYGAPDNGFAPQVALFTPAQWQDLRNALNRAVKEEPR